MKGDTNRASNLLPFQLVLADVQDEESSVRTVREDKSSCIVTGESNSRGNPNVSTDLKA